MPLRFSEGGRWENRSDSRILLWIQTHIVSKDLTRNGVWTVCFPLPPGQYRYMFVVDGARWMADPNAVASQSDGFGGRNSLLFHGR